LINYDPERIISKAGTLTQSVAKDQADDFETLYKSKEPELN
jgi:hypothetical protein